MKSGLQSGQLTKWKDDRGFGFIQPVDGSQEVFVHISALKDSTRRPKVGDTIYYHVVTEDGKIRACNAFIAGARRTSHSRSASSIGRATSNAGNKYPFPVYPFPVLEALLLSSLPVIGSLHFAWSTAIPIPLALYPVMSLVTYALYADDKSRAKCGDRRIPERTLHLYELMGGWLGGFIAQRRLHHKNIKRSYQIVFWAIVALHFAFWADWLFLDGTLITAIFSSYS
jgi:uncharacterized membrane protein YsdA (DUF1294 family)/cold shock CspA family protein